jgi:hypothetical protein
MESTAVRNFKPEWWGSQLVQEKKYQEEKACDKRNNNNNSGGSSSRLSSWIEFFLSCYDCLMFIKKEHPKIIKQLT